MSFFGFDASGPQSSQTRKGGSAESQSYDFQDTYEGLGEYEAEDEMNSETFGVNEVGRNFDFGTTANLNHQQPHGHVPVAQTRPNITFAQAAAANDDEFMKDLWGDNASGQGKQAPVQDAAVAAGNAGAANATNAASAAEHKVLSLSEIEAQLTAIDPAVHARGPVPPQQFYPGMPPNYGGYMMPQGFMPPGPGGQYNMPYPGQFMPMQAPFPPQMGYPGMPMPPNVPQQNPAFPPGPAPGQPGQPAPLGAHPSELPDAQAGAPEQKVHAPSPGSPPKATGKSDMSQFPVLGAAAQGAGPQFPAAVQAKQQPLSQSPMQQHQLQQQPQQHFHHANAPMQELSPEEQLRLARRQDKVAEIMRYSGVMNPKDKDFVTRFQLSQIVTEDPYNEDFYAQVYKVIHPKAAPNALGGAPVSQEPNSIAQAYLDQSGHRLGGRFKRADVALQRMQQQVQKAVSVAKERQKSTPSARAGVLGKISVGTGKKPRQQLVILSKAAQKAKDNADNADDDEEDIEPPVQHKTRSASMAAPSKPIKKYTKKDIMAILEDIINNLMTIESESRGTPDVDTTKLWESLHVLDQRSSSGDDESYVNPFIQCLNYSKALKVLPRLFKFLTRDQILSVITLVMANLENLKVIKDGSYTTYESKTVPAEISKLVDTYTLTFCKVLMNAVQDFKFKEILGLLSILAQHNVVSFVSTTKIGLSVITTLLSRAELMRGEGSISATDLSEWTGCYDELFTALESCIAAIFPPNHGDTEDDYVWQFLATLSLGGKLSHQRIIVEEVKDEIFGVMSRAKAIDNNDLANLYKKQSMMNNLNMYLVVMGLVADENEIQELKS